MDVHVVELARLDGRGDAVGHAVGAEADPADLARVPELLHDVPPTLLEDVVQRNLGTGPRAGAGARARLESKVRGRVRVRVW